MGKWEAVLRATEKRPEIDAAIFKTRGLGCGRLEIRNTTTGKTWATIITDDMDEKTVELVTEECMAQVAPHYIRSRKNLDEWAKVLGLRLEDWQIDYILSGGIAFPRGRRLGKTTAHQIKTLMASEEPLIVERGKEYLVTDEPSGRKYAQTYLYDLLEMRRELTEAGFKVREIRLEGKRDEG